MAKVLVAVALSDEEAELLEEVARRRGTSLGEALAEALRLYIEAGDEQDNMLQLPGKRSPALQEATG